MNTYVRTIRQLHAATARGGLAGEPLSEIILFGHGKDADVMIELLDGRQLVVPLSGSLRVIGCAGLESEVTAWDDRSLIIRYFGRDLVLTAARIGVSADEPSYAEGFRDEVEQWLLTDTAEDLPWAASIEIEVAPADARGCPTRSPSPRPAR
ncbi:hypothetical protein ACFXJ8_30580 [Nonomuraea sp. NPDC059194]|uniref:hypothetical protein n=1 Tax=Nonomuraea sp. NPDC059194 TaxID=3346764 RepID=UPI0036A0ECF7